MRAGICCPGEHNPYRKEPFCLTCGDIETVTKRDTARPKDLSSCPFCGTPDKLDALKRERRKLIEPLPTLRVAELTEEEAAIFREWRVSAHHELDCLRWIEGRRYDPENDPEFLNQSRKELAKWRLLSGKE